MKYTVDDIVKNKHIIKANKMATIKHADGVRYMGVNISNKATKAAGSDNNSPGLIQAKLAINATNIFDSHEDVHMPGLWDKSLKENNLWMLLKQHRMDFENVIADGDDVKASAEWYKFSDLGFDEYPGKTQVFQFDASIYEDRHKYMYGQYLKGLVRQHSVGMRYIKLFLAVDNKKWAEEFDIWQKYIGKVANRADAEENGLFWAVTEARPIEGSAVPLGSNHVTPIISIDTPKDIHTEPVKTTPDNIQEPVKTTQSTNLFIYL